MIILQFVFALLIGFTGIIAAFSAIVIAGRDSSGHPLWMVLNFALLTIAIFQAVEHPCYEKARGSFHEIQVVKWIVKKGRTATPEWFVTSHKFLVFLVKKSTKV